VGRCHLHSGAVDFSTPRMSEHLAIDQRYRGFADEDGSYRVALGGYVGGLLAGKLAGPAEVRLRGIVPMGRRLEVERPDSNRAVLSEAGTVLAEARRTELEIDAPAPVSLSEAEEASSSYPGFRAHLFPGCFTCGPAREPGDGLRIFPGPVADRELVAAPWTPDASLAGPTGSLLPEFVWAALDCPQLWALIASAPPDSGERVVTAGMSVRIESTPQAGGRYVILAWPMHREDRTIFAGGAVFADGGELLVAAQQRAVVVHGRGVPLGLGNWAA
jgi:hypothetical protein